MLCCTAGVLQPAAAAARTDPVLPWCLSPLQGKPEDAGPAALASALWRIALANHTALLLLVGTALPVGIVAGLTTQTLFLATLVQQTPQLCNTPVSTAPLTAAYFCCFQSACRLAAARLPAGSRCSQSADRSLPLVCCTSAVPEGCDEGASLPATSDTNHPKGGESKGPWGAYGAAGSGQPGFSSVDA